MFGFTGNPSHYIKLFIHSTLAILSFTQINSDSVDLHEINFCLVELLITNPFPILNIDPVWLFMSACTDNSTSIYHVKVLVSSASNDNTSFIVPFKKITTRNNIFQSPSFASLTLEGRNAISWSILGYLLFHKNIAFIA